MSASCFGLGKSSYGWAYNSLNQDPCAVATYLGQACNSTYTIEPIGTGQFYTAPTSSEANACTCSSVFYMTLSACGGCQSDGAIFTSFPQPIPDKTSVPHWAYENVTETGGFDEVSAEALGDAPETAGGSLPASSTSSTVTEPTSSSIFEPKPTPSASNTDTTPSSSHSILLPTALGIPIPLFVIIVLGAIIRGRRRRSMATATQFETTTITTTRRATYAHQEY
ncbi:hypothetical protein F5890DRAFT_1558548 [Lentinula detonsa]|uniref:Uncharacterized protein n=1 Tax=Lentinula detonsa TaxID=2804962 RepID=A0AA38PPY5_9AGAR|nr:hypothetical protein F5890DRAFT_1558548 [Lentinula detonsa]